MLGTVAHSGPDGPPTPAAARWLRPLGRQPRRILEALATGPGQNIDELAARLGLRRTAINHHLRVLLRVGKVVRVRQGRHALHFPVETPPDQRIALSLLRIPGVNAVTRDVFLEPATECRDRADRLGLSPRHVRRALRILVRHGMARTDPVSSTSGPITHLHPAMRLVVALQLDASRRDAGRDRADLP